MKFDCSNKSNGLNKSIVVNDNFYLLFFTFLSTITMLTSYNNLLKICYQVFILFSLFLFTLKKPNLVLPIFFITSVACNRSYSGFISKEIYFITFDNHLFVIFCLLGLCFLKLLIDKTIRIKKMWPLYFFILIMGLSYFYTDDMTRNLYYTHTFWPILIAYMITPLFVKSKRDFNSILAALSISGIQSSIVFIAKIFSSGLVYNSSQLLDRNYFSMYLIFIIIASLICLKYCFKNGIFKIIIILSIILNSIAVLTISSRSAFIILIIAVLVYFISVIKNIKTFIGISFIVTLIILIILNTSFAEQLFERFQEDDIYSANGRLDIAIAMLELFFNRSIMNMIIGTGYNSVFLDVYGDMYTTHNSFISYLMHYGIIGFICWIIMWISLTKKIIKHKEMKKYLTLLIPLFVYCFVLEPHIKQEYILLFVGLFCLNPSK